MLGPASTTFNDYLGTGAAADAQAVLDEPSLYELADIDRDRYTILAIDLTVDGQPRASVYAIDRIEHEIFLHADILELARRLGEVPVVQFELPASRVSEFIKYAFRRITVRLVTEALRDEVLVVTERSSPEAVSL